MTQTDRPIRLYSDDLGALFLELSGIRLVCFLLVLWQGHSHISQSLRRGEWKHSLVVTANEKVLRDFVQTNDPPGELGSWAHLIEFLAFVLLHQTVCTAKDLFAKGAVAHDAVGLFAALLALAVLALGLGWTSGTAVNHVAGC